MALILFLMTNFLSRKVSKYHLVSYLLLIITRLGFAKKVMMIRDLCKTPPFAQFRRQAQILILKILNVFLWLKLSPFLVLNKIERFAKVS